MGGYSSRLLPRGGLGYDRGDVTMGTVGIGIYVGWLFFSLVVWKGWFG